MQHGCKCKHLGQRYIYFIFLLAKRLRKQLSRNQELARSSYIPSCLVQFSVRFFLPSTRQRIIQCLFYYFETIHVNSLNNTIRGYEAIIFLFSIILQKIAGIELRRYGEIIILKEIYRKRWCNTLRKLFAESSFISYSLLIT